MARTRMASIVRQVRMTVSTIALLLILPVIAGLITTIIYSNQYQTMIRRMDRAAELKPQVETTLAENMFLYVSDNFIVNVNYAFIKFYGCHIGSCELVKCLFDIFYI